METVRGDTTFVHLDGNTTPSHVLEEDLTLSADFGEVRALAMTNSVAATIVDEDGAFHFDGQQRGICGAATREASLGQTRLFADAIAQRSASIDVIGVGGPAVRVTCAII